MGKRHKNTPAAPSKIVRHKKRINRKTKINLVFDKNARKDFLTGFHKRKLQRQLKAKEEMNEAMKAEKKRIKDEARNLHKTLVVSHRGIPELDELLAEEETYEFDEHNVVVKEISTSELAEENCWIGENKSTYDDENEEGDENGTEKTPVKLHTSKEIKKAVRNLSTQQIKKSKIFKKKGKMEQRRSRKTAGRRKKKGAVSKRDKHNNGAKIQRGR